MIPFRIRKSLTARGNVRSSFLNLTCRVIFRLKKVSFVSEQCFLENEVGVVTSKQEKKRFGTSEGVTNRFNSKQTLMNEPVIPKPAKQRPKTPHVLGSDVHGVDQTDG